MKLRLYAGYRQALIVQDFQVLATVVSQAFGGSKKQEVFEPKNREELELAFGRVFG